MRLSDNERIFLEAIRDNCFSTVAQVTQHCGFQRAMGLHYFRSLSLAGLVDGFEVTYACMKMQQNEPLVDADDGRRVDIRVSDAQAHRVD